MKIHRANSEVLGLLCHVTLRRLRNFWIPWVAMIVLGCFSDAVAQTSYKVIDLGVVNNKDNLSCAMDLNNYGWTLSMNGVLDPVSNFSGAPVFIRPRGAKHRRTQDRPRHAWRPNSWMNWGGINDLAQAVGDAETAVLDPNGEDMRGRDPLSSLFSASRPGSNGFP